jgi:hypothetical protein
MAQTATQRDTADIVVNPDPIGDLGGEIQRTATCKVDRQSADGGSGGAHEPARSA